jgi:hypothetical protein
LDLKSIKYSPLIATSDNDWKSIGFEKGTKYLLDNSTDVTVFGLSISLLMVFMFRSFKMVVANT